MCCQHCFPDYRCRVSSKIDGCANQDSEDPHAARNKSKAAHPIHQEHYSPEILERLQPPTIWKQQYKLTLDYNHVRFVAKLISLESKQILSQKSKVFGDSRKVTCKEALECTHQFLWEEFNKETAALLVEQHKTKKRKGMPEL